MKINLKYILSFIVLFITEVAIALFIHDTIIRPYIGDILVVILMYTLVKGLIQKQIRYLPLYLFIFATAVEVAQYFHIVDLLNLKNNKVMSVAIGSSFDIKDVLCYLAGSIILAMWERITQIK
jgi:hypothetical protein